MMIDCKNSADYLRGNQSLTGSWLPTWRWWPLVLGCRGEQRINDSTIHRGTNRRKRIKKWQKGKNRVFSKPIECQHRTERSPHQERKMWEKIPHCWSDLLLKNLSWHYRENSRRKWIRMPVELEWQEMGPPRKKTSSLRLEVKPKRFSKKKWLKYLVIWNSCRAWIEGSN